MKHIPILFSTPMVQAIIEGRKTQTRRVIKPQHLPVEVAPNEFIANRALCPYGQVGDILWVRESWQHTRILNINPQDENYGYVYRASENGIDFQNNIEGWTWKPSLLMPKDACRLFLKITDVRVENLQSIGEKDAKAEGVDYSYDELEGYSYKNYAPKPNGNRKLNTRFSNLAWFNSPIDSFKSLWFSINGEQSWNENPWVWVITFERTEKPTNWQS